MKIPSKLTWAVGLALLVTSMLTGCDYLPTGLSTIGEITHEPTRFDGREVKLRGTANQVLKIPFVDAKGYRLTDSTGDIVVWTTGQIPGEGEEVVVRGRVENLVVFAGQSYGLVLKEIERPPAGMMKWPWK